MNRLNKLLDNVNLIKEEGNTQYKKTKKYIERNSAGKDTIRDFLRNKLGLNLAKGYNYLKLEKLTTANQEKSFFNNLDDKLSYIILTISLKFLFYLVNIENDLYLELDKLLKYCSQNYTKILNEKFEFNSYKNRKALIKALNVLDKEGFITKELGVEQEILNGENKVLVYKINKSFSNFLNKSISRELLERGVSNLNRSLTLEQLAYQKLIFSPVIYKDKNPSLYKYIKKHQSEIESNLQKYFTVHLNIYKKMAVLVMEKQRNSSKNKFGAINKASNIYERISIMLISYLQKWIKEDRLDKQKKFYIVSLEQLVVIIKEIKNKHKEIWTKRSLDRTTSKEKIKNFITKDALDLLLRYDFLEKVEAEKYKILASINLYKGEIINESNNAD